MIVKEDEIDFDVCSEKDLEEVTKELRTYLPLENISMQGTIYITYLCEETEEDNVFFSLFTIEKAKSVKKLQYKMEMDSCQRLIEGYTREYNSCKKKLESL